MGKAPEEESLLSAVAYPMRWWVVFVLVAVVALAVTIGQTSVGHAMLRKAGLLEGSASYTSLAFVHPQSLPEQLGSKPTNVSVSFVIHNATGTPRYYQWSMLLAQGSRTLRVAAGSVRVGPGRGAAITRSARIFCKGGKVRIVFSLAHPAEFIDAWSTCASRRS
jgi:hypothetical protein